MHFPVPGRIQRFEISATLMLNARSNHSGTQNTEEELSCCFRSSACVRDA